MGQGGASGPRRRRAFAAALVSVLLASCAGTDGGGSASDRHGPAAGGPVQTSAGGPGGSTGSSAPNASASNQGSPAVGGAGDIVDLPPFAEVERSAAAETTESVLLTNVRTGRHDGFERIVFEFAGDERPGYQVQWAGGPVLADGSGNMVSIEGHGHLQIVMDQASGVDLETGTTSYSGPDRISAGSGVEIVNELVRTGDFEGVLTWVAGVDAPGPFRVVTLRSPTRLVVDIEVPSPTT